ncbi:MAG: glycosyltransferase family 9 protein [Beggiatoa sp.]|nr:glycosyltransferase family 9 protein [Beggiatoa sp.]
MNRYTNPVSADPTPGGTLVIQPLPGMGDMLWHLPHIRAIARAGTAGSVTLLTKRRSQADRLLTAEPAVREVLWLERNPGRHDGVLGILRLAAELEAYRFTEAFVLHGSGRYAFACRLAGIARRFGYGRGWQGWLLDGGATLAEGEHHGHPIAMADRLLERLGLERPGVEPPLAISSTVALGIGCSEPDRRWSEARFAALAMGLKPVFPTIFLLGGQAERDVGNAIAKHHPDEGCLAVIGEPIDEVAALLTDCGLFVGNDTGVYNLAAAVHIPAIGLFNGRYPPLAYSPFLSAITPAVPRSGMAGIGVDQVLAYVHSLGSA